MAARGPAPTARTAGRSDVAEWIEVEDKPFIKGRERACPISEPEHATELWWDAIREMPHAVLWTETDWIFAADTAVLKDRFYDGSMTDTAMAEMRRREDQMGTTVEARRKIRVRYVSPRVVPATAPAPSAATGTEGATSNVHALQDRRARLSE